MSRQRNRLRAAAVMGVAEPTSMFLGEDRLLGVVVAGKDRVAWVRECTRRTEDLDSGRDLGDDTVGGYHTDFPHIAPNTGDRIDCSAGYMDSLKPEWVGLHKGCTRRCNGPVVPRPPGSRSLSKFYRLSQTLTYFLVSRHACAFESSSQRL